MSELERIMARRSELDALAEELGKRLEEAQTEREELAIAERVLHRLAEQDRIEAEAAAAVAPVKAQVAGRAVLLIPHCGEAPDETTLPGDYRQILSIVRVADGPVQGQDGGRGTGTGGNGARETGAAAGEDDQARRSRLAAQTARREVHRPPVATPGRGTAGA